MPGTERPTFVGVAGLQQHRMSLRPGRQRRQSTHIELGTMMVDGRDAAGIDVGPGVDVGQHGVRCPAVPEFACDGEELLGATVTIGVLQEAATPEVLAGEGAPRGDYILSRAAVGELTQADELPCD